MRIEHGYQAVVPYFDFFFKIGEMVIKIFCFPNCPYKVRIKKTEYVYLRKLAEEYLYKLSSRYL